MADDDRPEDARRHRAEAVALLADFPDPPSTALRHRLQEQIGAAHEA
ncbi:hypothetical protein [Streptomyces sp. NPDC058373]